MIQTKWNMYGMKIHLLCTLSQSHSFSHSRTSSQCLASGDVAFYNGYMPWSMPYKDEGCVKGANKLLLFCEKV